VGSAFQTAGSACASTLTELCAKSRGNVTNVVRCRTNMYSSQTGPGRTYGRSICNAHRLLSKLERDQFERIVHKHAQLVLNSQTNWQPVAVQM